MPNPVGWDCVYCGAPADTVEHVVPRARRNWRDADQALRDVVVPACMQCNCTLGDYERSTLVERGMYLLVAYRKKWQALLARPMWGDAELEELGPMLREAVGQGEAHREECVRRLSFLQQWDIIEVEAAYREAA